MDKVLKELKENRQEAEDRFLALLAQVEEDMERMASIISSLEEKVPDLTENTQPEALYTDVIESIKAAHTVQTRIVAGLQESMTLHNARSAELARQLTVLPLERMDLVLDTFERRLETLEVRLIRAEKKLT